MTTEREWKLKGLKDLSLKSLESAEAEVEGIEGGKVLVVRCKDKVHALNANCSHYGAPLKDGIVSPDGRITCPWHGACFVLDSGDVEDAPAPAPLHTFRVKAKDGGVYIYGKEEDIKSGKRCPSATLSSSKPNMQSKGKAKTPVKSVVIVGSGSGCFGVILQLRELGFYGKMTVVSPEGLPYDRTKLSKALETDKEKLLWQPSDFYDGVSFIDDVCVQIDFEKKIVTTKSLGNLAYDQIVLASGGAPNALPLPGFKDGLRNVFTLRNIHDARAIIQALEDDDAASSPCRKKPAVGDGAVTNAVDTVKEGAKAAVEKVSALAGRGKKKVVIVGTSFIGMEVAKTLLDKGASVTLVGREGAPMERVFGPKVGQIFQKIMEKNGAKFYLNAEVEAALPRSPGKSSSGHSTSKAPPAGEHETVGAVKLKDGTEIPADLVVLGLGVKPATEYLKDNKSVSLLDSPPFGILVDDFFRIVKSEPQSKSKAQSKSEAQSAFIVDAWAIGDIAAFPYHGPGGDKKPVRIEHWDVAQNMGRRVASQIAAASPKGDAHSISTVGAASFIPVFWSALGKQLRYCGNTDNGYDDVVLEQATLDGSKFVAYFCKGEIVVAVASMQSDPVISKAVRLMKAGLMPAKADLKKTDILKIPLD